MILTDDDDDDDEGGRTRRPRRFPPFLFVVSKWIYLSTACTNFFICLVSCAPQLYFVQSWLGCFSLSCSYLDFEVPSQAVSPILDSYTLISCDVLFQVHK